MQSHATQPEIATAERQAFRNPRTHVGAGSAGHWFRMAGILSPLVIGELVKDPDKRWRWIRIVSVLAAFGAEGMYTHRIQQERQRCEQRQR